MKKRILFRSIILLISFSGVIVPIPEGYSFQEGLASEQESVVEDTFYALADAYISSGFDTDNWGISDIMVVGDTDYAPAQTYRSLIFFYIVSLPPEQRILNATLRIYHTEWPVYPTTSYTITTYRITSSWAETTVTWENRPDNAEAYGSQSILYDAYGWYEFDVTELVRGWYEGSFENWGIMLSGPGASGSDDGYLGFRTRESELDPELIIEYEPDTSPPTIAGLPDQVLPVNTNLNNAIDLYAYASDAEDADSALTFTINNSPNSSAGVSIDSNRYIDIFPSTGWTGVTNVEIKVTDTDGLSDTDTFQVDVTGGSSNSPPTISGLPDKQLPVNTSQNNAIDLWAYASDSEDADSDLNFAINNNPNPSAGISIDSNRYIDINPLPGWVGVTNVSIEVMDTGSLSDLDSFQVEVTSDNGASPPIISGLPDKDLQVNTTLDNAIDLWAYASDAEDADAALSFTINNNPNPSAGVSIDSNRYIDINPLSGWTGVTNVAIEVMDTDSYSDLDSFEVRVYGEMEVINLPIVIRNYSFTNN